MLRAQAEGQSSISVDGDTVGLVFDQLIAQFPGLKPNLIGDDGGMHKFVNVYVNDDDIRYLDKLDTKLEAGDTVTILPAVAGGAV